MYHMGSITRFYTLSMILGALAMVLEGTPISQGLKYAFRAHGPCMGSKTTTQDLQTFFLLLLGVISAPLLGFVHQRWLLGHSLHGPRRNTDILGVKRYFQGLWIMHKVENHKIGLWNIQPTSVIWFSLCGFAHQRWILGLWTRSKYKNQCLRPKLMLNLGLMDHVHDHKPPHKPCKENIWDTCVIYEPLHKFLHREWFSRLQPWTNEEHHHLHA